MDDNNDGKLKHFVKLCKENRIQNAILKGIPYVGASIDELIFGDDLEKLIHRFHQETVENQKAIMSAITDLMDSRAEIDAPIFIFGSANAEHIIQPSEDFIIGAKNNCDGMNLYGG